jgi:hypothetical protein
MKMFEIIHLSEVTGSSKNEIGIPYGLTSSTLFTIVWSAVVCMIEMNMELRELGLVIHTL